MAATATAKPVKAKVTRTRKPSAFHMRQRLMVAYHGDVNGQVNLAALMEEAATANGLAIRVVSRTRKVDPSKRKDPSKPVSNIANTTAYIAPAGYEFKESAARGVRISDTETADALRALATQLNVSVDDVIRAALKKLNEQ